MVNYVPDRGDIVWLNFEPQRGNEIKKIRPALVISPKKYNSKTNLAIFMPITSHVKGYPFEIEIKINNTNSVILCDQVRCFDWKERNVNKILKIDQTILEKAISKLLLLLEG